MAYATNTVAPSFSFAERFEALRAAFTENRRKARIYRATLDELNVLTDRELADIGVSRSEIRSIAANAAAEL